MLVSLFGYPNRLDDVWCVLTAHLGRSTMCTRHVVGDVLDTIILGVIWFYWAVTLRCVSHDLSGFLRVLRMQD